MALEIVKQTFVLERMYSKVGNHVLNFIKLENEHWTDSCPANSEMKRLYENYS